MSETTVVKNGNKLVIERTLRAPKSKVWNAYSDAEVFAKWWGPQGWSTTVKNLDFTPGGSLLYGMKCEDKNQGEWYGQESWGKMVYESISPEDSFSYSDYFCDSEGNAAEGMPVAKTDIHFEEHNGETKIISVTTYPTEEELDKVLAMGMEEGIKQTIDRLVELLEQ